MEEVKKREGEWNKSIYIYIYVKTIKNANGACGYSKLFQKPRVA